MGKLSNIFNKGRDVIREIDPAANPGAYLQVGLEGESVTATDTVVVSEVTGTTVETTASDNPVFKFWSGTQAEYNAFYANGDGTGVFNGDDNTIYYVE